MEEISRWRERVVYFYREDKAPQGFKWSSGTDDKPMIA